MRYLECNVGLYTYSQWTDKKTGELREGYTFDRKAKLHDCLESLDFVDIITKYRSTKEKAIKKKIPAFTPAGFYNGERKKNAEPAEKTNLIQIDIDHSLNEWVTDWSLLRDEIFEQNKFVAVCGLSCSGRGLFLLINTPSFEKYQEHLFAAAEFIELNYRLTIDTAVDSPNELRYFTMPNDVVYRDNASLFTGEKKKPKSYFDKINVNGDGKLLIVPDDLWGKWHYKDLISFAGKNNRNGVSADQVKKFVLENLTKLFELSSSVYNRPRTVEGAIDRIYSSYENQFAKAKRNERISWYKEHVYLIPSTAAKNRYAHILIDNDRRCHYYESKSSGKPSELLLKHISKLRQIDKWFEFKNEWLDEFDEDWIQRDTEHEIFFYYNNGTLRVTKDEKTLHSGIDRPLIWANMVLDRDYIKNVANHELAQLTQSAVLDYDKYKIAIGYLLHRFNVRTKAKAVWGVDHAPKSKNDGRRGKDLTLTITQLMRPAPAFVSVKWNPRSSNFWTSNIQPDTVNVHFEDVANLLSITDEFKRTITGDMQIEHKGCNIQTRPFATKPKISVTSQKFPLAFDEKSIRGRILLIEYNDYMQKNPPQKEFLYGQGEDLSAFDAWIIEMCQYYLANSSALLGVPELTESQRTEILRITYGKTAIEAVKTVADTIAKDGFVTAESIVSFLECKSTDTRTITKFKECYQKIRGFELKKVQKTLTHEERKTRSWCYEESRLDGSPLEFEPETKFDIEVPF